MKTHVALLILVAGFAGGAQAADPPMMVDVADPVYDWTGFYAGVFAGYGTGNVFSNTVPPAAPLPLNVGVSGWLGGVDLGYNWQSDQFVFGIEGDAALANIAGSAPCPFGVGVVCGERIGWIATLRGRAGLAADKALFYATAGLAAAGETSTVTPAVGGTTGTNTRTHFGYVVGVGAEVAVTEDVSFKAEYNYIALGTQNAPAGTIDPGPIAVTPTLHTVKFGANFHF